MDKLVERLGIVAMTKVICEFDDKFADELFGMFEKDKLLAYYIQLSQEASELNDLLSDAEQLNKLKQITIDFYKKELGVE